MFFYSSCFIEIDIIIVVVWFSIAAYKKKPKKKRKLKKSIWCLLEHKPQLQQLQSVGEVFTVPEKQINQEQVNPCLQKKKQRAKESKRENDNVICESLKLFY